MALPLDNQATLGGPDYKYPGTSSLMMIEKALTNYNEWIVDKFLKVFFGKKVKDARVLDFGAGVGTLSKIFYRRTGIRPDAFDIDPTHRNEMVKNGFRAFGSIASLPEGYDFVFTSNVLEHIEDDLGTLKSIRLHMKMDGTIMIYVPAFMFLWTAMDNMVEHVRRYSQKELCDKVRDAGFKIDYVGYCDSVGFILSCIFKYIGHKDGEMPIRSLYIFDRFLLPISKVADIFFSRYFGKNLYLVARKSR